MVRPYYAICGVAIFLVLFFFSCNSKISSQQPYAVVLGIAQDGGFPQAGTKSGKDWKPAKRRHVSCLAIVDPRNSKRWLIDATPDFKEQLHFLDEIAPVDDIPGLAGIFLTHAHIGHYTGLMNLGREVINAKSVPVYAMPGMSRFLQTNAPWDLLVKLQNIELRLLENKKAVSLNEDLEIMPFLVPHRGEYTETVGFRIAGPKRSILYISDIDKWEDLDSLGIRIEDLIAESDIAFLDGTFYADGEIPGRSMKEIPHPFIEESMKRFQSLPLSEKRKIYFIHLNRTNPAILSNSRAQKTIRSYGFNVATELEKIGL